MKPRDARHESALRLLDRPTLARLSRTAKRATKIENAFAARLESLLVAHAENLTATLIAGGKPTAPEGLDALLMEHAYATMREGLDSVESDLYEPTPVRLSGAPPKGVIPRTLDSLREWWRKFREGRRPAPRVRTLAEKLRSEYLENLQKLWVERSEDFRAGKAFTQDDVRVAIRKAVGGSVARARTIVATETTRYYNATRKAAYEQSAGVTHFLFISIRDRRTTEWCRCRSGLVYRKGTDLFERETPPIHWNCRSEIAPLSPFNPSHMRLIDDADRSRENATCKPLPRGWNK